MKKDIYIIILFLLSLSAFSSDIDSIFNKDFNYIKVITQTDEVLQENDKIDIKASTDVITLYQKEYTIFRKDNKSSIAIDSPQLDGVFYDYDSKIVSSTQRSFYTKLSAYWNEKVKQVILLSVDNDNKISEIKLSGENHNYLFDVSTLEPIDIDEKYIIVIARSYYSGYFRDYDNFIAIIRKRDLSYKKYRVDNSKLNYITFKQGMYVVVDNSNIYIKSIQEDGTYIKLFFDNVKVNYLTPTVNNLRFRETPALDGYFIRYLKKDEMLEVLEKGKTENVDDVAGTWVKVVTVSGEIGWCFDAYLKEVK